MFLENLISSHSSQLIYLIFVQTPILEEQIMGLSTKKVCFHTLQNVQLSQT